MTRGPARFSVVVPTHGRPRHLAKCVEGLARLDFPRERLEVIVVNDGADPAVDDVVAGFEERLDLKLVSQPRGGPGAARNAGAERAEAPMLAFTDDDCVPSPGWLDALARASHRAPGHAIGGRIVNGAPANRFSIASQTVLDATHAHWNRDPAAPRFFASNNVAFPADGFRDVGGFDVSFPYAEDRELCDRWLWRGYGMASAPEAVVHHLRELDPRSFWRQHYGYGRGANHFHRARRRRGSGRHVPELRFYRELGRHGLAQARRGSGVSIVPLLAASQVANLLGYLGEGVRARGQTDHSGKSLPTTARSRATSSRR